MHPAYLHRPTIRLVLLAACLALLAGCTVQVTPPTAELPPVPPVPTFTPVPPAAPEPAPPAETADSQPDEPEPEAPPEAASEPQAPEPPEAVAAEPLAPGTIGTGLVVNAAALNVRSSPDVNSSRLGQLQNNAVVQILEGTADQQWWHVCCLPDGATSGWVYGQFLDVNLEPGVVVGTGREPTVAQPALSPWAVQPANRAEMWDLTWEIAVGRLPEQRFAHSPTEALSPLTGLPISPERLTQRPFLVCIPSDIPARPQYGLSQADIVYEYLVDGYSITRLTGVFHGQDVPDIGPIRSARLVNFYLGYLYNGAVMCSGASDFIRRLLREVAEFPYFDIDLDNSTGRLPYSYIQGTGLTRFHTNTLGVRQWLQDFLREQPIDLQGFVFQAEVPPGSPATYVKIPWPVVSSSWVEYRYNPQSGLYDRYMGGVPHMDANTGAQIQTANIIVQYVPHQNTFLVEDSLGNLSLDQDIFGSGRAVIFRNGRSYDGTWSVDALGGLPRFTAHDGQDIPLAPGASWIALVPEGYLLTVQ